MSTSTAPPSDDAEIGGAPGHVGGVGAGHQRLGRHAAGVDAGAAEQLALDERDLHPRAVSRPASGGAGLAGADDDGVEAMFHGAGPD